MLMCVECFVSYYYHVVKSIMTCSLNLAGAVMADLALKYLGVNECEFIPAHVNNLANEFRCYVNYNSTMLRKFL